jgi:hypothetical protein
MSANHKLLLQWLAFSLVFHLAWEIAQLPLYTIYRESLATISFAVAHCTVGDLLIALGTYAIGALVARSAAWPVQRPVAGGATVVLAGLAYTAFSEWLNVSVRGSWQYAAAMPTVFGIGLSPLMQWAVIPVTILAVTRQRSQTRA